MDMKHFKKSISKLPAIKSPKTGIPANDPGIIPASGHDMGNYIGRYGMGLNQIQAVMKLDGRLDFEKLSRAVRLSVDEEVVLGCRFVENNPPYWKRIENLDEGMLTSLEISDKPEEAVRRFLENPLDLDKDTMVKVMLVRSPEYDTLCTKISHACADGAGAKEYLQLLSKVYTHIDKGESDYVPVPRTGGREDQDQLLSRLRDMAKKRESFAASFDPQSTSPSSIWSFPWKHRGSESVRFSTVRFPAGQLDIMSSYGKTKGATINDLVLAATYRAMFDTARTPYGIPMDIALTLDLRRYLPDQKASAIRNLTGGFIAKLARVKGETFDDTLTRVVRMTKRIKEGNPGVNCIIGAELMELVLSNNIAATYRTAKLTSKIMSVFPVYYNNTGFATISNVGYVSDKPLSFGGNVVTDAYIVPPVINGPGYVMVVCTYNGVLTLMIGYYKGSINRKVIDGFMEKVGTELKRGCALD